MKGQDVQAWIGLALFWLLSLPANGAVLVAYPRIESIYQDFLSGVSDGIRSVDEKALFVPIGPDSRAGDILAIAGKAGLDGIIWLGGEGLRLGEEVLGRFPMVFGMVYLSPEEHPRASGVTLQTEPASLLEFARAVLPRHIRLVYVHHASYEKSYLRLLKQAASRWRFKLSLHPVTNLNESVHLHRKLLNTLDGNRDALLLSPDSRVMVKAFYQDLLVESWKRKIPILSNFVEYSWAGVMIGSYPDPVAYGRQIAGMLKEMLKAGDRWRPRIDFPDTPRFAFNARYSQRLGIEPPDSWRGRISRLLKW